MPGKEAKPMGAKGFPEMDRGRTEKGGTRVMYVWRKIVSLTVVLALGAGITCGAAAVNAEDFTDWKDVRHQTAVSALAEAGVLQGDDKGNFAPERVVTRGEMTKVLTLLASGSASTAVSAKADPTYSDIAGSWAEGYIEYCADHGIVAGRGGSRFAPADSVTAQEAAKMLLTALGFQAGEYGLVGADWAKNTNSLAEQKGLYKDLAVTPTAGLNRDGMAQMVYNAMWVTRGDGSTLAGSFGMKDTTGGSQDSGTASEPKPISISYFYLLDDDYDVFHDDNKGSDYYAYPILANGEKHKMLVSGDYQPTLEAMPKNKLYKVSAVSGNKVAGVKDMEADSYYYTAMTGNSEGENGIIQLGGTGFSYTDDTVVYLLDMNGNLTVGTVDMLAAYPDSIVNAVVTKEEGKILSELYVARQS